METLPFLGMRRSYMTVVYSSEQPSQSPNLLELDDANARAEIAGIFKSQIYRCSKKNENQVFITIFNDRHSGPSKALIL